MNTGSFIALILTGVAAGEQAASSAAVRCAVAAIVPAPEQWPGRRRADAVDALADNANGAE